MAEVCLGNIKSELRELVVNGNKDAVLSLVNTEIFKKVLQSDTLDLINIVSQLLKNKEVGKTDVIECCDCVIAAVTENGHPEEVLLELIENAECTDEEVFLALVIPMQKTLLKICSNKMQSLEWVLNTIHRFVYSLPVPDDYQFESEEQLLLENDTSFISIRRVYSVILDFYVPFVTIATDSKSKEINLKSILLQSFIHLLGSPIPAIDLTVHKSKSVFRYYIEKIISWITLLSGNVLMFLMSVASSEKIYKIERDKDDHFVNCDLSVYQFLFESRFPKDAIGVFYYMLFYEQVDINKLPCVYSQMFIFENCLYFSLVLLDMGHSVSQFKGLYLAESVISTIGDGFITYENLESNIHRRFFEVLSKCVVYNEVKQIRLKILDIIQKCFKKYDCKSKYFVLLNLESVTKHSGLLGYYTTLIKDILVSMLNDEADALYTKYFSGKRLFDLIMKYSTLPNGVESDLVDSADKIIASLNLIRFLVLRDSNNISGVWDYVNEFQQKLFNPLRQGIILSKSHYDLKLKELKEKNNEKCNSNAQVTVSVRNENLKPMSEKDQLNVIHLAVNAIDLIDSILSRVNECISAKI